MIRSETALIPSITYSHVLEELNGDTPLPSRSVPEPALTVDLSGKTLPSESLFTPWVACQNGGSCIGVGFGGHTVLFVATEITVATWDGSGAVEVEAFITVGQPLSELRI